MQALYRTHRPQTFSELVGQEHVSQPLLKALEKGQLSHAFLFVGPRGTGKTSTARILAKALNCEKYKGETWGEPDNSCEVCLAINDGRYLDLIEIDAASNRGIDEIRDLREKIKLAPTQGKFKIYIIDEVHMLTTEAFNALLKTLEEPPPHAKFVLCTTDPQKIPATVKSRCQVYEFKIPTIEEIIKVLERTSLEEKKEVKKEDLLRLAKKANGAYRDALVLLEKYLISGVLDKDLDLLELANNYYQGRVKESLQMISSWLEGGVNPKTIAEELLLWNRRALLYKLGALELNSSDEWLKEYADKADIGKLKIMIRDLSSSMEEFRYSSIPQLPLELAIMANDSSLREEKASVPSVGVKEKIGTKEPEVKEPESKPETKVEGKPVEVSIETGDEGVTINIKENTELISIKERWLDLLRILRPINHSLEALLRSSEPISYQDGALTLRFFYRFHKERVEDPKNKMLVEKVFQDETGLPIHLNLVLSDIPRPLKVREDQQIEVQNVKIVDDKDIPEAALDMFTN